ncbi:MAG: ImmA/IrrE family metallo-endopeptidase [Bacteroidetes bacterium]|nr:ImmA/IrrE family metallo-endopeptidase [Bacteroidota bacterium]
MDNELPVFGPRKKVAKDLAKKLISNAKIPNAPVSLQSVIDYLKTLYTLDVKKFSIGKKVSGLLVVCKEIDSESATIGFNANHPWCRRRFTIAHEIGHLLLGHCCNKNAEDGSVNETEANLFASELLIPTSFLKKDFSKIKNVQELAKLYRVSEQALSIKLMETRLV